MQAQTDRLGVSALALFFAEIGWLFREQLVHDFGIDAHVEIFKDQRPTGQLIALQVKSGKSYFDEPKANGYVHRTDQKHSTYWLEHSMPVVLVIYHPETKEMYWQKVTKETLESTGVGWKILVPKSQDFSDANRIKHFFSLLIQPEPYVRQLNRLRVDRKWIDKSNEGFKVRVQFDDWMNKSLPRYQITLDCDGEYERWPMIYTPGLYVQEMLKHYFPWADVSMDFEAHRDGAVGDWEARCYAYRDSETGEIFYSQSFDSWYQQPEGIVPVSSDGEVRSYSLILTLNELGRSFLQVDDFLLSASDLDQRTFRID